MEVITKTAAAEMLAIEGHVFLGNTSKPLAEVAERLDIWERDNATRVGCFAKKRYAAKHVKLKLWFPSMKDPEVLSSIDLAGKYSACYQHRDFIVVHDKYPAEPGVGESIMSTVYFLPPF